MVLPVSGNPAPTANERDVSSFKKIVSGGAPIAPPTVEAFERQFGAYIHNIYGLTETTSPSHCVPFGMRAPVDEASGALSVGVPIFNTVVRVVDDDDNDLPPGEVGEIVTSGPQVVPGYWNQPATLGAAWRKSLTPNASAWFRED